jgi:hypothetical protein
MNITQTRNTCTQKCAFSFNYSETSIKTIIRSNSLSISFSQPNIPSVKFNGNEYNARTADIRYPSSNKYNGIKSDAEIIISHVSTTSNKPLIVFIPIAISSNSRPLILDKVINETAKLMPKTTFVNLSISDFTLNDIVPKGPFYFSDVGNEFYISYDLNESLSLSSQTFETLKKIVIKPLNVSYLNDYELFYNNEGSNVEYNGGSDFNFMQCEEVYEESSPQSFSISVPALVGIWENQTSRTVIIYTVYIIVSILVLYIFYRIITIYLAT